MSDSTYEFPGVLWEKLDEGEQKAIIAEFIEDGIVANAAAFKVAPGREPRPRSPKLAAAIAARQKANVMRDPTAACLDRCERKVDSLGERCYAKCKTVECNEACDAKMVDKYEQCADRCA